MKIPHVTVLMPVYNAARFLRPAIDSIFAQTFTDFELLIIDDGSIDETDVIIRSYADERIRIITHEENKGIIASLNEGIAESKGDYIARHDGDDISRADRLALQVAFLDANPAVHAVASSYSLIDEQGAILRVCTVPTDSDDIKRRLQNGNIFAHGSILFRKQTAIRLGG